MHYITRLILGIIILFATFTLTLAVFGPPPAVDLDHQGGTTQGDSARGIGFDSAGNSYLALNVEGPYQGQTSRGGTDGVVQKQSPDGTILWARQFGTTQFDGINRIAVMADGTSMAVGRSQGTFAGQTNAGFDDIYVVVHDTDGNQLGLDQYGGASSEFANGVATDGTHFYVVGSTYATIPGQTSSGGQDVTIYKYDSVANLVTTLQFGTTGADEAVGITVDPVAGRLYVAGWTGGSFTPSNGLNDGFIAILDLNLNILQTANVGGPASDFINGVGRDGVGNLYIGGRNFSGGITSVWVASFDSSLNQRWSRSFSPVAGSNFGYDIAVATDGTNYTVAQVNQLPGQPFVSQAKAGVLSLDADGNDRWNDQFGSVVGITEGYAIGYDPSGRAVMAGRTQGAFGPEGSQGGYDYITRRYVAESGGSNVIDDCVVIGTPGTWQLGQDLNCAGVAVDVQADDVTLEMNGYSIYFNSDGTDTIGVRADGTTNFVLQDSTGGSVIHQTDLAAGAKGISATFSINASLSDVSVTVQGAEGTACDLSDSQDARAAAMYLRYENANGKVMEISRSTAAEIMGLTIAMGGLDLGLSAWASSNSSLTDVVIEGNPGDPGDGIAGANINGMTLTRVRVNNAGVDLAGDDLNAIDFTVDGSAAATTPTVRLQGFGTFQGGAFRGSKVRLGGTPTANLRIDGLFIQPVEEITLDDYVELANCDIDLTENDLGITLGNTINDTVLFENILFAVAIGRALGSPLFENLPGNTARIPVGMILRTVRNFAEVVGEVEISYPFPISRSRLGGENHHLSDRKVQLGDDLGSGDRKFFNFEMAPGTPQKVVANSVDVSAQCTGDNHTAVCPATTATTPATYEFGQFIDVFGCGILPGPGNYDVMNDLSSDGADCLTLEGLNVKLNGMGHSITMSGGTEIAPVSAVRVAGDSALLTNLTFQMGSGFNIAVSSEPNSLGTTIRDSTLLSGDADDVGFNFNVATGTTLQRINASASFSGTQLKTNNVDAIVVEDSSFEGDVELKFTYGTVRRTSLLGNVTASSTPAEPVLRFEYDILGRDALTVDLGDNVYVYDSDVRLGRTGRVLNSATNAGSAVEWEKVSLFQYFPRNEVLVDSPGGAPDVNFDRLVLETTDETGAPFGRYAIIDPLGIFSKLNADWEFQDQDSSEVGTELDGTQTIVFEYDARTTPTDPATVSMHLSWDPNDPFSLGDCWLNSASGSIPMVVECFRDFGTGQIVVGEIHLKICGDNQVNPEYPDDCEQPGTKNCDLDCNYIAPNPMVEIGKGGLPGELILTWSGTGSSWTVYRSLDPTDVVGTGTALTTTTNTTYTDAPPDDGMDYYYDVRAN